MKLTGLAYDVLAEVTFTKSEVDLMIKYAKAHYDWTCKAAGLLISDGAVKNGFIAQLRMHAEFRADRKPYARVTWTFRQLDTALKVMERRDNRASRTLFNLLQSTCNEIYHRHNELKKEEQANVRKIASHLPQPLS